MSKKRYLCGCCGAEIDIKKTKRVGFGKEWLECLPPAGRDWKAPTAKKELSDGTIYYLDMLNNLHTREEFVELFGVDPEKALKYMRDHIMLNNGRKIRT